MFGYIAANKPELKIREYERYHAYYCGLCKSLKHRRGFLGQLTLSYDMTVLGILLTSLYEPHTVSRKERCVVHPGARHVTAINDCVRYAADMNLLLAYYDLLDNWKDDRDVRCMVHAKTLAGAVTKIRSEYPRQAAAVDDYVRKLSDCESSNDMDIDHAAGLTGAMLGQLFVWKEDEWEQDLYSVGFFMGKFIYLMDAYDDIEDDRRHGHYNPWLKMAEEDGFEDKAEEILNMMMSECSLAFERLPLVRDRELLRNVIYAGVWTRFTEKKRERNTEGGQKDV
jgi:hypothetical protein